VTTDNCLLHAGHTFLCGVIPGPSSKNIEVFLGPLLEELMEAYEDGFDVYDALLEEEHLAHVVLLCAVFDLRGITKFTSSSQHPSKRSCHVCNSQGQYLTELHTTTYDDAYTCLPPDHPLRHTAFQYLPVEYKLDVHTTTRTDKKTGKTTTTSKINHYKIDVDSVAAPTKTHAQVLADGLATERDPTLLKSTGQSKRPFATCLSYWDAVRQVHACVMHECENLAKMMAKCQRGLAQANLKGNKLKMERRRNRWVNLRETGGPKAPFVLNETEQARIVCDLRDLQVPRTHGGFIRDYLKDWSHVSAHDWKLLMGEMLIYLMRHLVSEEYAKLWSDLATIFRTIHSYRITLAELEGLRRDIALWRVQAFLLLPASFSTYVMHYLSHIPDTIEELGPAFTTWMYGNETLNGMLTSFNHASKDIEVSMVRKWLLYKAAFFHRVDSPGQHQGTVPVPSDPSSWSFNRAKTHTCSAEELAGFSSVLLARALYQYARTTQKVFNGIKAFRPIPASQDAADQQTHAHMWQSGKVTVQIDCSALPLLDAVNGYLYGTVHKIFLYQEHVIFRVCIWKGKLPSVNRVQLMGVQVPDTFNEFVYVLGSKVSSVVCLFLPTGHFNTHGRLSHYVVHVNSL
jgi:hypothetical protein